MKRRERALEVGTTVVAAAVLVWVALHSTLSHPWTILVFGGLIVIVENTSVLLPSTTSVSPGFMLMMASLTAFDRSSLTLAACLLGFCGGISFDLWRERRVWVMAFNCSQYLLAAAAAAVAYSPFNHGGPPGRLPGAMLATAVFAVVNVALVLPAVALVHHRHGREVWADMRPALPNYVAFGLLGFVIGRLYSSLGLVILPLVVVPAAIARKAFSSFLELREAHESTIRVFVRAIEAKDPYTAGHAERVSKYALYMGQELDLTPARLDHLRYAALMHDIGKLAVPKRLLNKPGKLTAEEYARVQRHNHVCVDLLTRVDFMRSMVATASDRHAHFAHDRDHTREEARTGCVIEGHIVAVADAFDAMTSTRSYRRALTQDVAFAELQDKAGTQFDPECVEALVRAIERRGEHYGLGYEQDVHEFEVAPPVAGVGSAGLGDILLPEPAWS